MTDDLVAKRIEAKAHVRHVRTEAGVHTYHEPIGSPIVAHPDAPGSPSSRPRVLPATSGPKRTAKTPPAISDDDLFDKDKVKWKTEINPTGNVSMDVPKNTVTHVYEPPGTNLRIRVDSHRYRHNRWDMVVSDKNTKKSISIQTDFYNEDDAMTAGLRAAKREYLADKKTQAPSVRPKTPEDRGYQNLLDFYEGVAGLDFTRDGSDPDENDFTDPDQRLTLAHQESDDLGIQVLDAGMDPNAHETINGVANAMETMYPGFNKFVPLYFFNGRPDNPNTMAANGTMSPVQAMFQPNPAVNKLGREKDHNFSVVYVTRKMFGDDDGVYNRAEQTLAETSGAGWWSTDMDAMKKAHPDIEPWRLAMMTVLTHEIGHTVAHIAMGNVHTPKNNGVEERLTFFAGLEDIFKKFDLLENDQMRVGRLPSDPHTHVAVHEWPAVIPTDLTQKILSRYGATNLHEMMAEAWAEYLLDPKPRAFAQEIGDLLESVLSNFLEKENGEA